MDNRSDTDARPLNQNAKTVPTGAAALAKGLALLDLVADAESPQRFAELQRMSGLPKPTFARILRTLIAFGLVRNDEEHGTYALGPRFLELSHKVWDTFDLNAVAGAELDRLSHDLGETVALCKLDKDTVQYLSERSGAGLAVRVKLGERLPLHCTAAGKAFLAFQEPSVSRGLIDQIDLEGYTETTLTKRKALEADLALIRARGYSVSYEEHLSGVNGVAVVIAAPDGTPLGALAVLAPASRLGKENIHPVGRDLIAAARRITGSAGAVAINSRPQPRVSHAKSKKVDMDCILPWGAQLGEAPVWHEGQKRLYWVDILRPAVYRFDPTTGINEVCVLEKLVSSVLPTDGQDLVVATQDGIELLDFQDAKLRPFCNPEEGRPENRLNDAKIGPAGSIWVGSMRMDAAKPTGGLYRVDKSGGFTQKESGISVSNGLAWSPDNGSFYFVDTVPGLIFVYDSVPGTGAISNRRVFAQIPSEDGRPDGITVDSEGGVWVALWDGWSIRRYAPNGKIDFSIEMPVPRPTSLCFGGKDNATLFVTSARTRLPVSTLSEAPLSGGIFAAQPGFTGLPSNHFTPKH